MKKLCGLFMGALVLCGAVCASELAEAEQLRDDALKVLQASQSGQKVSSREYALAVLKLERAVALCEQAHAEETPLAQEVSAARFWAGRFATADVGSEVARLRRSGEVVIPSVPQTVAKAEPPKPKVEAPPANLGLSDADLAAARARFESGLVFADAHRTEPFLVALRWFQIADETAGTDYSVKALMQAQTAQETYAASTSAAKADPAVDAGTPDGKALAEGDRLAASGNWDGAIERYTAAVRLKDTQVARKRLGHAMFSKGRDARDQLLPKLESAENDLRMAITAASRTWRSSYTYVKTNWNDPSVVSAGKKYQEIRKEASQAFTWYDQAFAQFAKALDLAPERKDFDAAAHQALCYSVRNDSFYRAKARMLLASALKMHDPERPMETALYGFCKAELERLSGR